MNKKDFQKNSEAQFLSHLDFQEPQGEFPVPETNMTQQFFSFRKAPLPTNDGARQASLA